MEFVLNSINILDFIKVVFKKKDDYFYREDIVSGKDLTLPQIKKKMRNYVDKLNAKGNQLVIIDPYLFPPNAQEGYLELLTGIVNEIEPEKLYLVYSDDDSKDKYDPQLFDDFFDDVIVEKDKIIPFASEYFHDRFWICPDTKIGFVVGTSLNGLGRKLCYISMLEPDDVEILLEELTEQKILLN